MTTVTRLGEGTVLVAVATRDPHEGWLARISDRLVDLYRPALGDATSARTRPGPDGRSGIVVVEADPVTAPLADVVVWGIALDEAGPASPASLTALLQDPAPSHAMLGRYVVTRVGDAGIRLVTSADLVHTLAHAQGPDVQAWATRDLAAAVAAGRRPRLAEAHVPEQVTFEFVFGDDSLLDGVRMLPEASVVDLRASQGRERSWWPVADRFAPGAPTTATSLRETLTRTLAPVAAVDGITLALTAGRDSCLAASVLAEAGARLPTFTIGDEDTPDAQGAAAVAAHLGWPHTHVGPAPGATWSLSRLAPGTRWTEGADTAWNVIGSPLRWPRPGAVWLSGSGGEIGRAVFRSDDTADPARLLAEGRAATMAPRAAEDLRARVAGTVADCRLPGRHPLDVLHARGRQRKWLGRARLVDGVHAVVPAYTSPVAVRALLDIPDAQRLDASVFDRALTLGGDLRARARQAVVLPPPPGRVATTWRRVWRRRPGLSGRPAGTDHAPLDAAIRSVCRPGSASRRILGDDWWAATTRRARRDVPARRWLWNAVAVDAFAALLETL